MVTRQDMNNGIFPNNKPPTLAEMKRGVRPDSRPPTIAEQRAGAVVKGKPFTVKQEQLARKYKTKDLKTIIKLEQTNSELKKFQEGLSYENYEARYNLLSAESKKYTSSPTQLKQSTGYVDYFKQKEETRAYNKAIEYVTRRAEGKRAIIYEDPTAQRYADDLMKIPEVKTAVERGIELRSAALGSGFQDPSEFIAVSQYFQSHFTKPKELVRKELVDPLFLRSQITPVKVPAIKKVGVSGVSVGGLPSRPSADLNITKPFEIDDTDVSSRESRRLGLFPSVRNFITGRVIGDSKDFKKGIKEEKQKIGGIVSAATGKEPFTQYKFTEKKLADPSLTPQFGTLTKQFGGYTPEGKLIEADTGFRTLGSLQAERQLTGVDTSGLGLFTQKAPKSAIKKAVEFTPVIGQIAPTVSALKGVSGEVQKLKSAEALIGPGEVSQKEFRRAAGRAAVEGGLLATDIAIGGSVIKAGKQFAKRETEKALSKELAELGEQRIRGVVVTELEEKGGGKFLLRGEQKTAQLTRKFELSGTIKESTEGFTFIPEAGGKSLILGMVEPTFEKGVKGKVKKATFKLFGGEKQAYFRPSTFEIGGASVSREVTDIAGTKLSRGVGIGTFTETRSTEALLKKGSKIDTMAELRKQFKKGLSTRQEVATFPTAGGQVAREIPKKDVTFSIQAGKKSEVIGFTRRAKVREKPTDLISGRPSTSPPVSPTTPKPSQPTFEFNGQVQKKVLQPKKLDGVQAPITETLEKGFKETAARRFKPLRKVSRTKPVLGLGLGIAKGQSIGTSKAQFQGTLQAEQSVLGQASASATDLTQTTNPLFDSIQDVSVKQGVGTATINGFITPTKTKTPTITAPEVTVPRTPKTPTQPKTGLPVPPKLIIPKLPKKPKLVQGQGYNVSVKRQATDTEKARFERLNTQALTRKSALSMGAETTDKDIAATFKISKAPIEYEKIKKGDKKGKKKVKKKILDTGSTYFEDNVQKFREYKKRKGKKLITTGRFIERRAYRLDTPSERQEIGQAPRRQNSGLFSFPGEQRPQVRTRVQTRPQRSVPLIGVSNIPRSNPVPEQFAQQEQDQSGLARVGRGVNGIQNVFDRFNGAMARTSDRIKVNVSPRNRKQNNKNAISTITSRGKRNSNASIFKRR